MQASEKLFLQTVGRFIADRFKTWTAPLIERIEKIESKVAAAAARATDGTDGTDDKAVAAADIQRMVDVAVCRAIAGLPAVPHVVGCYIDRAGDLHLSNSDGGAIKAGHVVGADADTAKIIEALTAHVDGILATWPKPKDGLDGFALDDFEIEFDGDRTITLKFIGCGILKEHKLVGAWPLYRGVWREDEYKRGDCVTHEGSTWIALADTITRPGTPDCNWQLANKKGRDGKSVQGPPGPPGQPGKDGRDLTQLGPDGKKW